MEKEIFKVKLIVDTSEKTWCFGMKGQIFEVYDDGGDYMLADESFGYLKYDQCEIVAVLHDDNDKSVLDMAKEQLDKIDTFQNKNRGFKEDERERFRNY